VCCSVLQCVAVCCSVLQYVVPFVTISVTDQKISLIVLNISF